MMDGARVFVPRNGHKVAATVVRRWQGWGLRRDRPIGRPFYLVEFDDGSRRVYDLELIQREESHA